MTETINDQSITKSLKLLSNGFKNEFATFVFADERTAELLMELSTEFVQTNIPVVDEDNWFDPCHVEKMVQKLEEGNQWVYSLRKIYDKDGNFLCEDNCESLGKWPVYFRNDLFHIDTSSFAVRRDVAVRIGHSWYGQWGADRQFFNALKKNFPQYESTNQYTCCYRLDGNENSVNREFFDEGNAVNEKKYGGNFPWKSGKRLITIGPGISIVE